MIVCYGDAIIDLFARPTGASLDQAESFVPFVGGSTCNVAIVAARHGSRVRFVGAVGDDRWGQKLLVELCRDGIDCSAVAQIRGARTPVTFVTLCGADRQFLSYRNGAADSLLGPDALDPCALDGAVWLHLASSTLRTEPRASATRELLRRATIQGIKISLDLNARPGLWTSAAEMRAALDELASQASLIKASDDDLRQLGFEPTVESLQALAPAARVILTLGERGAQTIYAAKVLEISAPTVSVVDTTGAGDAFVGALLSQLERDPALWGGTQQQWYDTVAQSCAVGAVAVTALGATQAILRRDKTNDNG